MADDKSEHDEGNEKSKNNSNNELTRQDASDKKDKSSGSKMQQDARDPPDSQQAARPLDQPRPRRPRPIRPNQFRMVALAAGAAQQRGTGERVPIIEPGGQQQAFVGVPIEAHIELASGVLQPAGRVTMVPPKRPNYPPSVALRQHYAAQAADASGGGQPPPYATLHHHHHPHRFQPTTSLGATALTSGAGGKPNRYSWAQMQQWHAAHNAAVASAAGDATGDTPGKTPVAGHHPAGTGGFHYHLPTPFSSAASRVLVVPNPIVNLSEHTKSRLIKFIEAIKRFSEKWFSHVLLLLFLASYACFGAYIFISFEAPNEQWEKLLIIDTRFRIVNETYDLAKQLESRELFVDALRVKFEDYERLLNRACANGMTSNSLENQWTFWGALFYSMTVFTTIGYGHLTPVTFAGRVATMIYAIFGIPILLMVLADLGKLLTRIIKYAFKKFRYLYNKLLGRKASVRTRKLITDNTNQYIGHARHAFERGFASYIQPYQSRLPNAFLREFARAPKHNDSTNEQHQSNQQATEQQSPHELDLVDQQQQAGCLESSEVIITPVKQTKPVSPKIDDDATNEQPPLLAPQDQERKQDKQQQQQEIQTQQKSKHKDSKFKRSRKASSSQKPTLTSASATTTTTITNERRTSQKQHSVTRSSSASNVDKGRPSTPPLATSTKRASLDNHEQRHPEAVGPAPSADLEAGGAEFALGNHHEATAGNQEDHQDQHHNQDQHNLDEAQLHHHEDEHEEHDEFVPDELDEDLDIPVSFALFLLITYMMFGAVVFSIWESWNFFDSLYFVFISMSTIGFGDLVPQHPKRMIGTFAYLLFGLALTSMCINVVQEKIHATFLRAKMQIGEKMGFDLDQIMADDYYHDGGSAYGDENGGGGGSEEQLDENGSFANSIALSQTNSATQVNELAGGGSLQAPVAVAATATAGDSHAANTSDSTLPAPAISRSKSKESLKWKKRSLSGAGGSTSGPGHGAGGSSSMDQHSSGSASKRKISSGSKKAQSAAAQVRQQQQQQQHQQQAAASIKEERQVEGPGQLSPIKHQIETIRMLNVPVMLQQLEERPRTGGPGGGGGQGQLKPGAGPSINQPIDGGVRAFCEPLRRAFQAGQRPKLVASRSQPSSPYHLNRSQTPAQTSERTTSAAGTPAWGAPSPGELHHQRHYSEYHHNMRPGGGGTRARLIAPDSSMGRRHNGRLDDDAGKARSLASSRRGSVSDELNRLDDLIVALSKSPPERFGPLLGIPSSRSSRSNSPASSQLVAAAGNSPLTSGGATTPRRGTSLMVRGSSDSVGGGSVGGGGRRPLSRLAQERQRSFNSTASNAQTPPFQTPSGSNSLLAASCNTDHQLGLQRGPAASSSSMGQPPAGGRRKSSSSSGASRFAMVSAKQSANELNLGESQAALDELEAVRYSAV